MPITGVQPRRDYESKEIVEMAKTLKPNLSGKRLSQISLSDQCKQVILGGLIGDACLTMQKGYKNARLQIRHSIVQEGYMRWKFEMLKEIAPKKLQTQKPDGYSSNKKLGFMSLVNEDVTKIYQVVSKQNKLDIKRSWLNHLTELGLLIWWLDDGSIIKNGRNGVFCTDGFELDGIKILQDYLKVVWKIETTLGKVKRENKGKDAKREFYYRMYLNNRELRKLFHLIMPLMKEPTMIKKMCLTYKDPQFQQRWISEMKAAMPTMHTAIDAFYEGKKDIPPSELDDNSLLPRDESLIPKDDSLTVELERPLS